MQKTLAPGRWMGKYISLKKIPDWTKHLQYVRMLKDLSACSEEDWEAISRVAVTIFLSLTSRKSQKNLPGQYNPVAAIWSLIIYEKLHVKEIQEGSWEAQLWLAMTNPHGLQCLTITFCSCLPRRFFLPAVLPLKALFCTSRGFSFLPLT